MTRGGWGDGTLTEVSPGKWKLRLPPYLGRGQVTFLAANKTEAKKQQRRLRDEAYRERFDPQALPAPTFSEMVEWLLGQHTGDRNTVVQVGRNLKGPVEAFGGLRLDDPKLPDAIEKWRRSLTHLAPSTAHGYMQAVKQTLNAAVNRGLIELSPARHLRNPQPKAAAVFPFETVAEVEAVAAELPPEFRLIPVLGCGTGMRPEEWLALERGDIRDNHIHVNKRWVDGMVKAGTKNGDAERIVPLHPWVADAISRHPVRIDTRLLIPSASGTYLSAGWFRAERWNPALEAAGVRARRIKDMRHTFATWQLTGNCNVWHLSKVMGTAVQQLERTYGRWIPGSEQVVLAAMDQFMAERQTATK